MARTYGEAVADVLAFRIGEGERFDMTVEQWQAFASKASFYEARARARSMGIQIVWDCELAKTPDGFYQIQGGIDYAIAKSLGVAPFADILWMETKTADLHDAKKYADAVHAVYPDKMLAYNLSPSFNWDTTGMSDDQMRKFPEELGKMGFVFDFITYGGHQIDGLAAEEFATALKQDGMLALARLQRESTGGPLAPFAGYLPWIPPFASQDKRNHGVSPVRFEAEIETVAPFRARSVLWNHILAVRGGT